MAFIGLVLLTTPTVLLATPTTSACGMSKPTAASHSATAIIKTSVCAQAFHSRLPSSKKH